MNQHILKYICIYQCIYNNPLDPLASQPTHRLKSIWESHTSADSPRCVTCRPDPRK